MKIIYRLFAELTGIIHGVIFFSGLLIGFFWELLLWYYTIIFTLGIPSWIILRRCFVTDIENWLRLKSGQDISHTKESFLGYWGVKIFGKHAPSNRTIFWIIVGFYIVITPIWIYAIYVEYIL